jgi:hypothetical protein
MQEEQPLYATSYIGFYIRIYPNRVEFRAAPGRQSIPLAQIASVQLGMMGIWQITLETTGGQKYSIPTKHKKEVQQAIYNAQARFLNSASAPSTSAADEIAKLHELKEKGIITEADFEKRKNQILGT